MLTRTEKNKAERRKIVKEDNKKRNIKTGKFLLKLLIISIVILSIIYFILRFVGNYGLIIKETTISYYNVPDSFNGIKITQFSDLHYGTTVKSKEMENVIKTINETTPDLVVFTGDLIDKSYSPSDDDINTITILLNNINCVLGKYAIKGDQDGDVFDDIMKNTDFIVLDNSYDLIYNKSYEPILITGIGSNIKNNMDIEKAFTYDKDIFTISLFHEPDIIDSIKETYKVDLAMAGHSLNDQINLKFIRLSNIDGAKNYYKEYYIIGDTHFFISGGIGTTNVPFRLFNHPSINLIRIKKDKA